MTFAQVVNVKRHRSQLTLLKGVLDASAANLAAKINDDGTDAVYGRCRTHERLIALLEQVWTYYRDRFDQRRDQGLRKTLDAGDVLLWSCWSPLLADAEVRRMPLLYFAPITHTQMVARANMLGEQKLDPFFAETLALTPLPLIEVPAVCLTEPWWLVTIAHEVGHVFASELHAFGNDTLLVTAKKAVIDVVDPARRSRWTPWVNEMLADVVSVLLVGAAAVWAIAELEWRELPSMLKQLPQSRYPSPARRLALLHASMTAAKLATDELDYLSVSGWEACLESAALLDAERSEWIDDAAKIAAVAAALLGAPTGRGALSDAFGPPLGGDGPTLDEVVSELRGGLAVLRNGDATARAVIAGSVAAFQQLRASGDERGLSALRTSTVDKLLAYRRDGTWGQEAAIDASTSEQAHRNSADRLIAHLERVAEGQE